LTEKCQILAKNENIFPNLLSKAIPLRKFKISLNQSCISREVFSGMLKSLNKVIEKLEIDIGAYYPQDDDEILELICSFKNICSLELQSLKVVGSEFFLSLIEAVYSLKFLKIIRFGEISGQMTRETFVKGIEKILLKKGLKEFYCSNPFKFESFEKTPIQLDEKEIRKKNPCLQKAHFTNFYDLWKE